jgi:antitoxin component of MazEF toxin-antitoxin module
MRRIGNSCVVLIPEAFMASCQIEDQVNMQLLDGQILIKPVRRPLREDWFSDVAEVLATTLAQEQAEGQDWLALPGADDGEWVW